MGKEPFVYILATGRNGTLYVGMTTNLARRMWEHRNGTAEGFTLKYQVHRLVHVERYETIADAVTRERQVKTWKRDWKLRLIEEGNPEWRDLYEDINK